jgi:S1-C subfamily serine protease
MRTKIFLCLVSGTIGAILAIALWDQPHSPLKLNAAEPPLPGPQLVAPDQPAPSYSNQPAPAAAGAPQYYAPQAVPGVQTVPPNFVPPTVSAAPPNPSLRTSPVSPYAAYAPPDGLTPEERINVAVYENVNKCVVNITTQIHESTGLLMFESNEEGTGSGSVLDHHGDILTNAHVIEGANDISVTLFDGSQHKATVVGRDAISDVAVVHIDAPRNLLFPVHLGDSTHLLVGQRVFAIGNPFGLERTLTTGIISSLNRTLPSKNNHRLTSVIQTDAAINPGNSGGPLLDSHGLLIGMNTAIASRTGQSAGIGFAIPVSNIGRVASQLINSPQHKVLRPETGILRVYEPEAGRGIFIATMTPGGPAEQAGLHGFKLVTQQKRTGPFVVTQKSIDRSAADMIVGVDNQKTTSVDEFLDAVESHRPGEIVQLHIIRDHRELIVPLQLGTADS